MNRYERNSALTVTRKQFMSTSHTYGYQSGTPLTGPSTVNVCDGDNQIGGHEFPTIRGSHRPSTAMVNVCEKKVRSAPVVEKSEGDAYTPTE